MKNLMVILGLSASLFFTGTFLLSSNAKAVGNGWEKLPPAHLECMEYLISKVSPRINWVKELKQFPSDYPPVTTPFHQICAYANAANFQYDFPCTLETTDGKKIETKCYGFVVKKNFGPDRWSKPEITFRSKEDFLDHYASSIRCDYKKVFGRHEFKCDQFHSSEFKSVRNLQAITPEANEIFQAEVKREEEEKRRREEEERKLLAEKKEKERREKIALADAKRQKNNINKMQYIEKINKENFIIGIKLKEKNNNSVCIVNYEDEITGWLQWYSRMLNKSVRQFDGNISNFKMKEVLVECEYLIDSVARGLALLQKFDGSKELTNYEITQVVEIEQIASYVVQAVNENIDDVKFQVPLCSNGITCSFDETRKLRSAGFHNYNSIELAFSEMEKYGYPHKKLKEFLYEWVADLKMADSPEKAVEIKMQRIRNQEIAYRRAQEETRKKESGQGGIIKDQMYDFYYPHEGNCRSDENRICVTPEFARVLCDKLAGFTNFARTVSAVLIFDDEEREFVKSGGNFVEGSTGWSNDYCWGGFSITGILKGSSVKKEFFNKVRKFYVNKSGKVLVYQMGD